MFWGCLGGFLSAYEGFSAEIAILVVLGACGKASGVDLGGLSALENRFFFTDLPIAASLDDHPKGLIQQAAKRRASTITRRS